MVKGRDRVVQAIETVKAQIVHPLAQRLEAQFASVKLRERHRHSPPLFAIRHSLLAAVFPDLPICRLLTCPPFSVVAAVFRRG
jgi:hypothetical protein